MREVRYVVDAVVGSFRNPKTRKQFVVCTPMQHVA